MNTGLIHSSFYRSSISSSSTSIDVNLHSKSNRRKTLKTLFRIPLDATRSSGNDDVDTTVMKTNTSGSSLPHDIIREIVDLLSPTDILNFSLTSSYLRHLLLPALYDTVVLRSSKNCRLTLAMLLSRPHLCSYIKKLAVRPNYYLAWPKADGPVDEGSVVKMIIDLSKHLTNMHTFDWDGLELPKDELWEVLRVNCPQLKGIFTNVGTRPLDPQTALFSFSNLTSFSLIVRHGLAGSELFPVLEEIPPRFWDMVLTRCPDLQELAICSFSSSSRVFNFERITQGRWSKLHTLTLGSFGYQSDFTLGPLGLAVSGQGDNDNHGSGNDGDHDDDNSGASSLSLGQFLDLHSELKYIRFLWNFKRWMSPTTIPISLSSLSSPSSSQSTSLPNLDTFIGIYQQLNHIPHPEKIETLDLTCEPVYESRLTTVVPILRKLTGLTSLDIWMHVVDIRSGRRSDQMMGFFKNVLEACPGLVDFHFMCTTSFTVSPLKHLLSHLHLLPRLKRFSLTKGHKYGDESMLSTVLRILKCCPKLVQVNIRWAREKCLNHLKQEGVYDVVEWEDGGSGGGRGRPKMLTVFERGIPLVGKPFSRRYKYTLPGGGGKKRWMLGGERVDGGGGKWRWGRKRRAVSGVASGGDVDETVVNLATVGAGVENVETEGVESESDLETDTEVEVEEEEVEVEASGKGKEVKRIGLTPTTVN